MVIDSGVGIDTEKITDVIKSHGYELSEVKKLILTHYHGDHAGGAAAIRDLTGCQVYAPAKEAPCIAAGDETANAVAMAKGGLYPADYVFRACPVTALNEGDTISLGEVTLKAYAVPGHSLEGMVYYGLVDGKNCLFTGDSIFAAGQVLIQPLPDVSLFPYAMALKGIAELPIEALFPGHGVFCQENGVDHIKPAVSRFFAGLLPPQLYYFA